MLATTDDRHANIIYPSVILLTNADLLTGSSGTFNLSSLGHAAFLDFLALVVDQCVTRITDARLFAVLQAVHRGASAVGALSLGTLIVRASQDLFTSLVNKSVAGSAYALLLALTRTLEIAQAIAVSADYLGNRVITTLYDWLAASIDWGQALLANTDLGAPLLAIGTVASRALQLNNLLGVALLDQLALLIDQCESCTTSTSLFAVGAFTTLARGTRRLDNLVGSTGLDLLTHIVD